METALALDLAAIRDLYARHVAHARKLGGPSPVGQRNSIRQRKVWIAQAAGVAFRVVDDFARHLDVPKEALARMHTAMEENWWE